MSSEGTWWWRWWLVSWCFEPSQPQRIIWGLRTNASLSPSYPLNKLLNVPHKKINNSLSKHFSQALPQHTPYFIKHTNLSKEIKIILTMMTICSAQTRQSLSYTWVFFFFLSGFLVSELYTVSGTARSLHLIHHTGQTRSVPTDTVIVAIFLPER